MELCTRARVRHASSTCRMRASRPPFLDICHNKLLGLLFLTPVFEMFCIRLSQEKGGQDRHVKRTFRQTSRPLFLRCSVFDLVRKRGVKTDMHKKHKSQPTCTRVRHASNTCGMRASRPWQTVESDAGLQGLPEAHRGIACTRARVRHASSTCRMRVSA